MHFSLPMFDGFFHLLNTPSDCWALFRCLNCAQRFDYRVLGSSQKLGGAAEHFIDGSEKRICRLRGENWKMFHRLKIDLGKRPLLASVKDWKNIYGLSFSGFQWGILNLNLKPLPLTGPLTPFPIPLECPIVFWFLPLLPSSSFPEDFGLSCWCSLQTPEQATRRKKTTH